MSLLTILYTFRPFTQSSCTIVIPTARVNDHSFGRRRNHTEQSHAITNQGSSFQRLEGASAFFTMLVHIATQEGGGGAIMHEH